MALHFQISMMYLSFKTKCTYDSYSQGMNHIRYIGSNGSVKTCLLKINYFQQSLPVSFANQLLLCSNSQHSNKRWSVWGYFKLPDHNMKVNTQVNTRNAVCTNAIPEAYLEPSRITTMELFCENK